MKEKIKGLSKKEVSWLCIIIVTIFVPFSYANLHAAEPIKQYVQTNKDIVWSQLTDKEKSQYYERVLLSLLYPDIQKAVNNYYGNFRQFDKQKIIYMKPKGLKQEIQVQVSTFVGPHNPPYGLDTITFILESSKLKAIDFKHQDL